MIAMGGKAAETLYYGHDQVSLGAIQDLKQAKEEEYLNVRQYIIILRKKDGQSLQL